MNQAPVERIIIDDKVLALVVRKSFSVPGANFFTPSDWPQQLGMLVYEKGKKVLPHQHRPFRRETDAFTEVLVLLSGKLKVDLYDQAKRLARTVFLEPGDSILFASGGHAIEVLEDAKILEVKQGPYIGQDEKEFL